MEDKRLEFPAGMKKTKQRECVLAVLERSDTPLSAMEICSQASGECSIWLSTVYRILELFVKEGFVVKAVLPDGETALYELSHNRHRHYAVCLNCRKIMEMENCPLEKFEPEFTDGGFRVLGHKLEMYGYCKDCDKNK